MARNKRLPLVLLVILAIALPLLLISIKQTLDNRSGAAAPDKLETEGGTLTGNAQVQTDSTASGGNFVELGINTTNLNKHEAENFTLSPPMQIGSDTNALNGQYISPASGGESTTPTREASLSITIPSSNTYYVWARMIGPTLTSDALYVGIDSSWDRIFPSTINTYEWVRVENGINSGVNGFSLTAGTHTIQVGHGEIGARLDSVYLTTDPNEILSFGSTGGSNTPTPTAANTPTPTSTTGNNFEVQGFGTQVTGGAGMPIVHVTNLNDSGSGSLRQALSAGNRTIVFDVAGTITTSSTIYPVGNNITIDGTTAPGSGITLRSAPLYWNGNSNFIVRGLRFRDQTLPATGDSMTIKYGANNFIVDHCSFSGADDASLDITEGSHDGTVQWSILGTQNPAYEEHVMQVSTRSYRISVHHNLFWEGVQRHPQVGDYQNPETLPHPLTADVRNNLVWAPNQGLYGFTGAGNTTANLIRNYYYIRSSNTNPNQVIETYAGASVYAKENYERRTNQIDGTVLSTSLPSSSESPVESTFKITMEATAKLAAEAVLNGAGSRVGGLDSIDQAKINAIRSAGL